MKRIKILFAITGVAFVLMAFKMIDDIISRLGMEKQSAQYCIIQNIIGRYDTGPVDGSIDDGPSTSIYNQLRSFRVPYARLLPDIIAGDKVAAAADLCTYIKNWVTSEEFMTAYNKSREAAMPLTDNGMSLTSLKRNSEVFRINIKNYPTDIKYVAEQQKQLDENEKRVYALQDAMKKPFAGKDLWEKAYPADPALLIKKRLQEFLQISATVDYSAKLTGSGKKQIFVNPVFEKKSLKWKAIYRAGKEVNDRVSLFVNDWLKEGVKVGSSK
jgi:hypothetical protein